MKFRITIKDHDGQFGIRKAAKDSMPGGLGAAEHEAALEKRVERLADFVKKWLEYGEYVRIEFDTDAGTARLLRVDER